jgi:PPOX class probable F420-dependent enzyme
MIDLTTEFGRVAEQHLNDEYVIWLSTVDSHLTPQPRPVWFIWDNGTVLIFSKPDAFKVKHIRKHSRVALHFNTDATGDRHVIIFTGEASIDPNSSPAKDIPAYLYKYRTGIADLNMTPEGFSAEYSIAIRIQPTELRGWE